MKEKILNILLLLAIALNLWTLAYIAVDDSYRKGHDAGYKAGEYSGQVTFSEEFRRVMKRCLEKKEGNFSVNETDSIFATFSCVDLAKINQIK